MQINLKIRAIVFVFSILSIILNIEVFSKNKQQIDIENLSKEIAQYSEIKKLNNLIVYIDGKTIYTTEGIDENSQFFIASISKQFAACLLLMILYEKNNKNIDNLKKDLHLPLDQLLKKTKLLEKITNKKTEEWLSKVTLHMLMTHTSGFLNMFNTEILKKVIANTIDILSFFQDIKFRSKKIGQYTYSDANYIILAKIIEEFSGKSFAECLKQYITEPLKMSNTYSSTKGTFRELQEQNKNIILHSEEKSTLDISLLIGCGSMVSSAKDLYIWTENLHSENPIMDKKLYEIITAAYVKTYKDSPTQYAYGIAVKSFNTDSAAKEIFHKGDFRMLGRSRSFVGYYTKQKFVIIFLTSNNSLQSLIRKKDLLYKKLLKGQSQ